LTIIIAHSIKNFLFRDRREMKCPKCKYTTFDYVDTCPRCGKDISGEKANLHILSVKPNTPFLLGSLTGDLNETSAAFVVPESVKQSSEGRTVDAGEVYDDGSELNINIDEEPVAASGGEESGISDFGSGDEEYEMEIDLHSKEKNEEIEVTGDQESGSEDRIPAHNSKKKAASEDLELEIEDLDLQLDVTGEEDADK
jgi:hypothetical protein